MFQTEYGIQSSDITRSGYNYLIDATRFLYKKHVRSSRINVYIFSSNWA